MSKNPHHYFMVTALLTYTREDAQKQRHMNSLLQLPTKKVTSTVLNNINRALLQRLWDESQVPVENVLDVAMLGISYLGHMTEQEFIGKDEETAAPAKAKTPFDA